MKKTLSIVLVASAVCLVWMPVLTFAASFFTVDDAGNIGIGNSTPQAKLDVSGAMYSRLVTASSTSINWNSGNVQSMTLNSNQTLTFSNGQAGGEYKLILTQDSTGSRTITWPASVLWLGGTAPTLSTAANSTDVVSFLYNGTSYLGSFGLGFVPPSTGISFSSSANGSASTGNPSTSYTVSGTNTLLVVFIYMEGGVNPTSVTYDGVNLTNATGNFGSPASRSIWYLTGASTGSHTLQINNGNNAVYTSYLIASYNGVKQTGALDTYTTAAASGTGTNTVNMTTGVNNVWTIMGVAGTGALGLTAGSGSTQRENVSGAYGLFDSNGPVSPVGSTSMSYGITSNTNAYASMVSFAPAN